MTTMIPFRNTQFDPTTARAIEIHSHLDTEDGIALLRTERIDFTLQTCSNTCCTRMLVRY